VSLLELTLPLALPEEGITRTFPDLTHVSQLHYLKCFLTSNASQAAQAQLAGFAVSQLTSSTYAAEKATGQLALCKNPK